MRGRALPWARALWALALLLGMAGAQAQGVELTHLTVQKQDGALTLDFTAKLQLSHAVEDAVQRGVPLYFVAQADVWRKRWYWRDAHISTATRTWRLSYQPLSDSWRVSLGGLGQSFPSLNEALNAVTSSARWRIAEAGQVEGDEKFYVEFVYKLDTSQLPRPMQFGITGSSDWALGVERTVRVE